MNVVNSPTTPSAEPRQVPGHELIALDRDAVWSLDEGELVLFALFRDEQGRETRRRHLGDVAAPATVFGTAAVEGTAEAGNRVHIVAQPFTRAVLTELDREHFYRREPAEVRQEIDRWLSCLTESPFEEAPAVMQVADAGQEYELWSGDALRVRARTTCWLRIDQGEAVFRGSGDLIVGEEHGPLPLAGRSWIQARRRTQLEPVDVDALGPDQLEGALRGHQRLFLAFLAQHLGTTAQEEYAQLEARRALNAELRDESLGQLARTLDSHQGDFTLRGSDALVRAAERVGAELGVPVEEPREDNRGAKRSPIDEIARASHLRARRVLLNGRWWTSDHGPLVGYRGTERNPVALLARPGSGYELFDPESGESCAVDEEVAARLDVDAHMFYRPLPDHEITAKDLLRFSLRGKSKSLLSVAGLGVSIALAGMVVPQATGFLVETAIPDSDRGLILQLGLALLAVALGKTLFEFGNAYALARFEVTAGLDSQAAVWDRLLKVQPSFFRRFSSGDLLKRVFVIDSIREQVSGTTLRAAFSSLIALLYLALMFYYSAKLALVAALAALTIVTSTVLLAAQLLGHLRSLQEVLGRVFGLTVQLINGVSKLKVSGAEDRAFAHWTRDFTQQQKHQRHVERVQDRMAILNSVIPLLTTAAVFWFVGVELEVAGELSLTAGTFLAFNTALGIFIGGATDLSNTVLEVLDVRGLWERAKPVLSATTEVDEEKADPGALSGKLALERVTFRYNEGGPVILDNLTLRCEPGEFVALVGPSGSGKSTILRLLLGFETPEAGAVLFDDKDLGEIDIQAVRRQLGVVLQETRLMSGSIFEIIAGGATIRLEDAWTAARESGLAEDIEEMPMGMHTVVSEGATNLSGGQRQRLLIARALVHRPRVLLFDEATSALDNRTQAVVSASLDKLQVTRVVIAHRLTTVENADRIFVLESGRVTQEGTFQELAEREGLFRHLMRRQMA